MRSASSNRPLYEVRTVSNGQVLCVFKTHDRAAACGLADQLHSASQLYYVADTADLPMDEGQRFWRNSLRIATGLMAILLLTLAVFANRRQDISFKVDLLSNAEASQ